MKHPLRIAGIIATAAFASMAYAQTMPQDTDGDGVYSMAELEAAFPELTDEGFVSIDANGDGLVDAEELAVAMNTGALGG